MLADMSTETLNAQRAAAYRRRLTNKQLEAEVFAHASRSIKLAESGSPIDRVRAVADNRRLWSAVHATVIDPTNALPTELRGKIASVALTVVRECESKDPDLAFVAGINEQFAAGLWS
jgi:flagellar biosynthesis regulator FlaF